MNQHSHFPFFATAFGWLSGGAAFVLAHSQFLLALVCGAFSVWASVAAAQSAKAARRLALKQLEQIEGDSEPAHKSGRVLSWAVFVFVLFALAFTGRAADVASVLAPDNPLVPALTLLGGSAAMKLMTWMGAFRVVGKPLAKGITDFLAGILLTVKGTKSTADDHFVDRMLGSTSYAIIAWLIDYLFTVKLPRSIDDAQPVRTGPAVAALLAFVLPLVAMSGCKSPEQAAYRTIGTIAVTVDSSMQAWGQYVRDGHATAHDEDLVRAAYEKYQVTMRIAQAAEIAAKSAPADQSSYATAVAAVSAAAGDIVGLVQQFIQRGKSP